MQIVDGYKALAATTPSPCAVGIGVFDGVHLGHQALIERVVTLARENGLKAVAYTFAPHPARLFAPQRAPQLIEPVACRLERLAALGIDCAIVESFDRQFANHSPTAFVTTILQNALAAQHVVVGAGFSFGHKQQGDVALLHELGLASGFTVHPVTHVEAAGSHISSTQIRACISAGDIARATEFLGRPFMLEGRVVQGAHRGALFGLPTANLAAENELRPKPGVYAAWAQGEFGRQPSVVNIGTNPTFEVGDALKIEAHLLGYQGADFYNTRMRLHVLGYIRPERRFSGIESLKTQVQRDIVTAEPYFKI